MLFSSHNALKKACKLKQEHDLDKKMSEKMLKELNQLKKTSMKNDSINMRADETLSSVMKSAEKEKEKEEEKKKLKNKSKNKLNVRTVKKNQIEKLISKFESLMLNLNVLSEKMKQQNQQSEMPRLMNMTDFEYASNLRTSCYECDLTEHLMRVCFEIDALINRKVVHQDDTD